MKNYGQLEIEGDHFRHHFGRVEVNVIAQPLLADVLERDPRHLARDLAQLGLVFRGQQRLRRLLLLDVDVGG